jgi:hypothetical protein
MKEESMDKMMEFIEALMKSQKEFMESWVTAQKEFMENWIDTTKKIQETVLSMGGAQEGTAKETLNLYKSWISTAMDTSKVFNTEAGKVQETWKNTVEKQMDMIREMLKNLSGFYKKAA